MKIYLKSALPNIDLRTLIVQLGSKGSTFSVDGHKLPEKWTDTEEKHLFPQQTHTLMTLGMGEKIEAEPVRRAAHLIYQTAKDFQFERVIIQGLEDLALDRAYEAMAEGLFLSDYFFGVYKSKERRAVLREVLLMGVTRFQDQIDRAQKIAAATCVARDLVNEPTITLTSVEIANRMEKLGEEYGFSVEVFHKAKIQSLKMGGLLAVNMGSEIPPTFTIMEYKPEKPTNEQPIVLVGKGVVYDTGGLSLKPTANSMDFMKADMGGAAAVIGAMCGIAALKIDKHVIGLVPSTDNRPGKNAYTPGDVIKMYDGTTVEVLNTDAEGRMLLADALAYAKQYNPELVIDLATLTGAKVVAIGSQGVGMMSTADAATKDAFKYAGENVYERLVEFPLWKEYGDLLKSEIADMKNIGGREAGSITAGKFLEHFTDFPWIHLDIAGSAFFHKPDSYRGKQGTGVGVRLLIEFLTQENR